MKLVTASSMSVVVLSVGLCIPGAIATAADTREVTTQLARTEIHPVSISWLPQIAYESVVLTVDGPKGFQERRTFAPGEPIHMAIDPEHAAKLADGQYAYELRFAPVIEPEARKALKAAREAGDSSVAAELKRQGKLPEFSLVQSGYFRMYSGALVVPGPLERDAEREPYGEHDESVGAGDDVVGSRPSFTGNPIEAAKPHYTENLTVDGNACIGQSCTSVESFGFDVLRLKDDNVRFKVEDTSGDPFPSNDWRIAFNESTSGGASMVAIEDYDGGTTPFTIAAGARHNSLYVDAEGDVGIGTSTPVVEIHAVAGNSPNLRLEQDSTAGFTAQSWDIGGHELYFYVRDATDGSKIPFRIYSGSANESLTVGPTGVEVNVAFSAVSDVNKKTGLTPVDPGGTLEKVADLPVTTWSFKDDPSSTTHLGPTAQDFHQTFELGSDDRHIAPLDAVGVALAAIQGLNTKVETSDDAIQENLEDANAILTRRLAEVEEQNAEIVNRLLELENLLTSRSDPQ